MFPLLLNPVWPPGYAVPDPSALVFHPSSTPRVSARVPGLIARVVVLSPVIVCEAGAVPEVAPFAL